MALNAWEKDFIAEIKARVLAKQPVSLREKQMVMDLVKREQMPVRQKVLDQAAREGVDVSGISVV
jgi:hypothetical protein